MPMPNIDSSNMASTWWPSITAGPKTKAMQNVKMLIRNTIKPIDDLVIFVSPERLGKPQGFPVSVRLSKPLRLCNPAPNVA